VAHESGGCYGAGSERELRHRQAEAAPGASEMYEGWASYLGADRSGHRAGRQRQTTREQHTHGPHEFYPHLWPTAAHCPGWTEDEANAEEALTERLRDAQAAPAWKLTPWS
jgi:hypothetical protein